MLSNDTHQNYHKYVNRFVTNAFELDKGKWQGEFIGGEFFQVKFTYGILLLSSSEMYYNLGYKACAVGHDTKTRTKVCLPEILNFLFWHYDPDTIWYT